MRDSNRPRAFLHLISLTAAALAACGSSSFTLDEIGDTGDDAGSEVTCKSALAGIDAGGCVELTGGFAAVVPLYSARIGVCLHSDLVTAAVADGGSCYPPYMSISGMTTPYTVDFSASLTLPLQEVGANIYTKNNVTTAGIVVGTTEGGWAESYIPGGDSFGSFSVTVTELGAGERVDDGFNTSILYTAPHGAISGTLQPLDPGAGAAEVLVNGSF